MIATTKKKSWPVLAKPRPATSTSFNTSRPKMRTDNLNLKSTYSIRLRTRLTLRSAWIFSSTGFETLKRLTGKMNHPGTARFKTASVGLAIATTKRARPKSNYLSLTAVTEFLNFRMSCVNWLVPIVRRISTI